MKNLAGNKDCDTYIREELEKAGISVFNKAAPELCEVPYTIFGGLGGKELSEVEKDYMVRKGFLESTIEECHSFFFTRAWYYWRVRGYVPLSIAKEMYANPNGAKDIRVVGHCGCPPPEDQIHNHKVCGLEVISSYHIDTQEGLNYFVQTMVKHNLV